MKLRSLILFAISAVCVTATASLPAVGEWRVHPSYYDVTQVVDAGDKVFALADGHLFSITKADKYIETYTKADGLNDNSVSCIAYDSSSGKLVIAYSNSNIDILDANGVIHNIADIRNKDLRVDKSILSMTFYNGYLYLCTGFGIVAINLSKYEVKDTYVIGTDGGMEPVYSLIADGPYFYALMGKIIKKAPVSGENLLDFNTWKPSGISLPNTDVNFTSMCVFANSYVVAGESGGVYRRIGDEWSLLLENHTSDAAWIHVSQDNLLCGRSDYQLCRFNTQWQQECIQVVNTDAIYSSDGLYWVASRNEGLRNIDLRDWSNVAYKPDGPYLFQSQRIISSGTRTLVAPGHSRLNRGLLTGAVMIYEDGSWNSYTSQSSGAGAISPDGWFMDVVSTVADPSNPNHIYATTWGEGVYEFIDGKAVALYNTESTNGVLKSTLNYGNHFIRADGLAFDSNGNLWVATSLEVSEGTYNAICYMTPDKVWHEATGFSPLETCALIRQIHFHSNGTIFILSARDQAGIFVKKDNNKRFFKTFTDKDGKTITPTEIYDMAEDKSGTVWVGTNAGPVLFSNVSKIFETSYRCTRVKIPREDGTGLADYLLDGIPVKAIEVDGANRKWIGTTNGVYVVSADGLTTYHHFTTENSPLPSDEITSIAANGITGSVIIGTGAGIVEYRDGVTEPVKKYNDDKIVVYPNPVTPDFTGFITLTGLENETVVKVTDASGHLVYEGKSNGGSFSWDGKSHGSYVSGGVYFFHLFNTDENNSRSSAAKVLIIR